VIWLCKQHHVELERKKRQAPPVFEETIRVPILKETA
jgi:hypothetical protein